MHEFVEQICERLKERGWEIGGVLVYPFRAERLFGYNSVKVTIFARRNGNLYRGSREFLEQSTLPQLWFVLSPVKN